MPTLTQDQLQALEHMRTAGLRLSQESFLNLNVPGVLKGFLSQVQSILQFSSDSLKLEPLKGLTADQHKFLKLVKEVPYSTTTNLMAYRPEGMIKTYLEFLAVLVPTTHHLKSIQSETVQPYAQFLAKFVSDKTFATSARDDQRDLEHREKLVKDVYSKFTHLYGRDQFGGKCKIKDVVHRGQDWALVLQELNECVANVESVDRQQLEQIVTECNDYVRLIVDNLKAEPDRKVSQEMANRLSAHAYNVAREVELFATTYYRVLALVGTVEKTIETMQDSLS